MTTSETLYRAADIVEERGLGVGAWGLDGVGPVCTEGAIAIAAGIDSQSEAGACPAALAVCEYLGFVPAERQRLYNWNDQTANFTLSAPDEPLRTTEEVVEVLRRTALVESVREQDGNLCTTSAAHVRSVAARHDLPVIEAGDYLFCIRRVPLLGQPIIYRATVSA